MIELSRNETLYVSAGVATRSGNEILVTDGSTMFIHGAGFTSQGCIYNSFTNEILFNADTDGDTICLYGYALTAIPVQDGYLYTIGSCS